VSTSPQPTQPTQPQSRPSFAARRRAKQHAPRHRQAIRPRRSRRMAGYKRPGGSVSAVGVRVGRSPQPRLASQGRKRGGSGPKAAPSDHHRMLRISVCFASICGLTSCGAATMPPDQRISTSVRSEVGGLVRDRSNARGTGADPGGSSAFHPRPESLRSRPPVRVVLPRRAATDPSGLVSGSRRRLDVNRRLSHFGGHEYMFCYPPIWPELGRFVRPLGVGEA